MNIKNLIEKIKNPRYYGYLLTRLYFKLFGFFYTLKSKSVMEFNWDVLIILDACRYDIFKKRIKNAKFIYSLGSSTIEFLIKNLKGKKYKDTIYITANPFVDILVKDSFYKVVPAWKLAWNKKYGTVLPNSVIKISKLTFSAHRDKRFIIHFMQPHYPFISDPRIGGTLTSLVNAAITGNKKINDVNPWYLVYENKIDEKRLWVAYEKNLDYVLPYAIKLAKFFSEKGKKVVITADHGNIIKKFGPIVLASGHPSGVYFDELIKVPWYVFKKSKE